MVGENERSYLCKYPPSANGFVPFLGDVLARCIPLLPGIKIDNMRHAFATALRQMAESLVEYLSAGSGDAVAEDAYKAQFEQVYDAIVAWPVSKDTVVRQMSTKRVQNHHISQVRGAHMSCIGELCHVISIDKLVEEIKKLVTLMLAQCRKGTDPNRHRVTRVSDSKRQCFVTTNAQCRAFVVCLRRRVVENSRSLL